MAKTLGVIVDKRQRSGLPWRLVLSEVSERGLLFAWHFKHYFKIEPNFGRKVELHFALEKFTGRKLTDFLKLRDSRRRCSSRAFHKILVPIDHGSERAPGGDGGYALRRRSGRS